jgi:flagellar hook-associated protein 1 FlgK
MSTAFQSLDIARRALWASQLGMDITSHNISNVNTKGFSRQRIHTSAAAPFNLPEGQLGLGVRVDTIIRIRNVFLDQQYRDSNDKLGYASSKENIYRQVEIILQEPNENSIGSLMNDFFLEFSRLASDPENMAIRYTLRQKANALVESFQAKNNQLKTLRDSIKNETQSVLTQINEITKQLAVLNKQIVSAEAGKGKANDLRDKRDKLLDQLSEYLKLNVSEGKQGQIIASAEGINLVTADKSYTLSTQTTTNSGNTILSVINDLGKENVFKYGKLGSLLEMANRHIPDLEAKLNTLVYKISEHVNNIHAAGQTLPTGNPPSVKKNINFFVGTSAEEFNLSSEVLEDVSNIAASANGKPGNGDAALSIANIRKSKILNGGRDTFEDYYSGIIQGISFDMTNASNTRSTQELLINQVENQRQSVSGVSLDEEMTNLIKYQRSYEAAAKVIQAVDEMMETLINIG